VYGGGPLLQVQSQAGDEEPHSGVDEEWQTQNPRLLLSMQCQDGQLRESAAATICSPIALHHPSLLSLDLGCMEFWDWFR
jgi:hypothetical protein